MSAACPDLVGTHLRGAVPKVTEEPFDTFDTLSLRYIPTKSRLNKSPRYWAADFHYWAQDRCVFAERHWSPVGDLHVDFTGWNITRNCCIATFEALLREEGFYVKTQAELLWVYGLTLTTILPLKKAARLKPSTLDEQGRLVIAIGER